MSIPQSRSRQIERGQLLERMDEGMNGGLILLVAPAGFGKTTLAAAWARKAVLPTAWLSLQPADHPPDRFLSYLVQALQTVSPQLGQTTLALLQSGSRPGVLYALLNDLAEFQRELILILDDYHAVDYPEVAQIVQFLLENRPPNLHLIITSRVAPSFSLAKLRAQGQVTELSSVDLRFSSAEMRDFLERCMSLQLPPAVIARLGQLTEGWAVGLQLAGLALARQPVDSGARTGQAQQPSDWTIPGGQALIFDYLAEEVLQREPPEVQEFLKKTALLDRFCIPLCETLLYQEQSPVTPGSPAPGEILAYVERANLFLVPLDAGGAWFRYHALFTDFLRRQLPAHEHAPLYQAASRWFEQNALIEDAIHYAIHAEDYQHAAGMLEGHYISLIQRGEQAEVMEWVNTLPPAVLEQHPRLELARGWASVISLNSDMAVRCADDVERRIPPGPHGDRIRGEARALRVLANIFGGRVASAEEITATFALLFEQDDFLHCLLHFNLGLNYVMQGQTAQAVEAFTETLRLTAALPNPLVTIVTHVQLGETRQIRGALGLAERAFQQVIRHTAETLGERTALLGMPYISYADLLREQNRFDQAVWYAERGIQFCQRWQPVSSMDGHIALARLRAAQRSWDDAFHILEKAVQIAESSVSVLDDTFVAVHLARLALLQGDLNRADRYINAFELDKPREQGYYHLWEMARLVQLRAAVAHLADHPAEAAAAPVIEQLSALIAEAERRERVSPVIEALILRAYAENTRAGSGAPQTTAAHSLTQAITLGAQCGYVRLFADEGRPLLGLLEQYRTQIHAPRSYFNQILQILRSENAQPAAQAGRLPARDAAEALIPLTRRELDILEFLAAGKTNQEIAVECTLALTTVKKHVANILGKLEVSNRTQAVAIARKRGWIQ